MKSYDAIIRNNVSWSIDTIIEPYCYIGISCSGKDKPVRIGRGSHIRAGTYIYEGVQTGEKFQTGNKVNIREHTKIGNNVSIGTHSVIEHHVFIESNVRIHSNVFIPEYTILKFGCWIAPNVVFTNAKYPNTETTKDNLQGVVVEEGAIIGANATILPGIRIGKNSFVGAGSLVTRSVPADHTVYGNPAEIHGLRANLRGYKNED